MGIRLSKVFVAVRVTWAASTRAAYHLCDCQIFGVFCRKIYWQIWPVRDFLQFCVEVIYNIFCGYVNFCSSI